MRLFYNHYLFVNFKYSFRKVLKSYRNKIKIKEKLQPCRSMFFFNNTLNVFTYRYLLLLQWNLWRPFWAKVICIYMDVWSIVTAIFYFLFHYWTLAIQYFIVDCSNINLSDVFLVTSHMCILLYIPNFLYDYVIRQWLQRNYNNIIIILKYRWQ